jgi:hypothetical protein
VMSLAQVQKPVLHQSQVEAVQGLGGKRLLTASAADRQTIRSHIRGDVIRKILQHLKLAADPPPIAPARQAAFAWDISSP